ncbi:galactokinase [Croceitalea rosinachiae]|uniref:Galactokinase n=1 Tax=Croceitalea rosinachiae TaxID=3075596 RepID=A0ABU3A9J9_9FLAO|nr:galactokinase [Croceitalea sp. F388]MDT0605626.1 galactokinase [Croceitalea sp. F388]
MDWKVIYVEADVIIESPGRINLIGEHIDYNGGLVLPAAIDKKVTLYFKKSSAEISEIYSKSYDDNFVIDLNKIEISDKEWHNYFLGVIHFIQQSYPDSIENFDCVIESDLPIGSGVSSSAALECGIAKGLSELFEISLPDDQIITMSRDAEHHFVGTKCGIMDQFAVVMGKKNKLLLLNCDDLNFEYVTADIDPYKIVLLNTNVSHNLATSEYNLRRNECEFGLKLIQEAYPEYATLASVPISLIQELKNKLNNITYKRISYVIEENNRTVNASKALIDGNIEEFANYLFQSHKGLKEKYEVSCKELDFLVDFSKDFNGVIGARMMGGGFGGCTINLVHQSKVEDFIKKASKLYAKEFELNLSPFTINIGEGVKRINK